MQPPLLIVGASARAAAFSACRAGFSVSTLDLFADADLQARCVTQVIEKYPCSLVRQAQQLRTCPWLYTGGLENYPAVVDRLARERPLVGNPGPVLRAVRDPFRWSEVLSRAGFDVPDIARSPDELPCDGSWLMKPRRSSGGHGIRPWRGESLDSVSRYVWQQRIEGAPHAALFLGTANSAPLIGVTQQWVGADWCHAAPFHYCGSIGPMRLHVDSEHWLRAMGALLASELGLRGLFGVDLIVRGEQVYPIEINPRYPASAEVLERVCDRSLIGAHVQAFDPAYVRQPIADEGQQARSVAGKCVLFAPRAFKVTPEFQALLTEHNARGDDPVAPLIADIPAAGSHIAAGWPVVTLLADGQAIHDVQRQLTQRATALFDVMAAL